MWGSTIGRMVTLILSLLTAPFVVEAQPGSARSPAWAADSWLRLCFRVPY